MASSYAHVLERPPPALAPRLDTAGPLDSLQAKKNFSVSHLLDLEEAGDLAAAQGDEGVGEGGRSLLESPGLTSGSDTQQQDGEWPARLGGRRLRQGGAGRAAGVRSPDLSGLGRGCAGGLPGDPSPALPASPQRCNGPDSAKHLSARRPLAFYHLFKRPFPRVRRLLLALWGAPDAE